MRIVIGVQLNPRKQISTMESTGQVDVFCKVISNDLVSPSKTIIAD
jgi:hypothetical protein